MTLDLSAEAQLESAAGEMLQVPGELRCHHRAARKGDRHVGREFDSLGVFGRDDQRQEGVVTRFRCGQTVEAQLLTSASCVGDAADVGRCLPISRVLIGVGTQDHCLHAERHSYLPIASDAAT